MKELSVSSPGRICLFGEDVDYMRLEVITMAINQRIEIKGKVTNDGIIRINLSDYNKKIKFSNQKQKIKTKRDYIASAFNLYYEELPSNFGVKMNVSSNLPIGKGLSSSSAFVSALVAFFDRAAGLDSSNHELARKAYQAEVVNMGEPGGIMDHFASIMGGIIYLECSEPYKCEILDLDLKGLVIGDTLKRKETVETLIVRKREIESGIREMINYDDSFNIMTYTLNEVKELYNKKKSVNVKRLLGILGIRDVVREGYAILKSKDINKRKIANLINKHHKFQSEYFENVTEKMQELIDISKKNGALGCKLLGSGNGGSFLAFAPGREDEVIKAIQAGGSGAYKVRKDKGLSF